ncbi:MAG: hypothetical protein WCD89_04000 [Anaerocolumna sp.]
MNYEYLFEEFKIEVVKNALVSDNVAQITKNLVINIIWEQLLCMP